MSSPAVLCALSSHRIASLIREAKEHVCYLGPGIQDEPAAALVELLAQSSELAVSVSLDFDERTIRMGYGSLNAVQSMRDAGIPVTQSAGTRIGVLIVDHNGWVFSPTALYLEGEPQSDESPNALRLTETQVKEFLIRLSPEGRRRSICETKTPEESVKIDDTPFEGSEEPIKDDHFDDVKEAIEQAPPVNFDVARQVRVFEPYLQYVELSLSGASIQRKRVAIPRELQRLGSGKDLEGRLRTTFDLVEKSGKLSSKSLEDELNMIRRNFTPSLGKDHGRVVLKAAKPHLIKRLQELRSRLEEHQKTVETELQTKLDESRKQAIEYYFPAAKRNPPDALLGQLPTQYPNDDDIRNWIDGELRRVFPEAKDLVKKMSLEERYKDVTFETLNQPNFLSALKEALPKLNWDKAYQEFMAAGQSTGKAKIS